MSREIRNQRVLEAVKKLPGRDEEIADASRGYVGWGPHEDAMASDGRTVEHATWQDLLGAIQNPAREVHDFYFAHHVETEECSCCAGSGKNRDYAELEAGFYSSGSGRWRGWGNRLRQEEIDLLIENRRLGRVSKGEVTPENLYKHLGRIGHDAINRWILTPARAKHLGIPVDDCFECVGTGYIPVSDATIQLHVWTFDIEAGESRVDTALHVPLEEIEEVREFMEKVGWEGVKRRFGWAIGDNMHPDIEYVEDWQAFTERKAKLTGEPSFRGKDGGFPTWQHFHTGPDPDLNLVFSYKVVAPIEARDEMFAGTELPETFGLIIWMTHPRKGTDVVNYVREARREDEPDIKAFLRQSFEVHGRHFAWAAGRAFGNEIERDEPEAPDESSTSIFLPSR